ncbi:hypothetical protein C8R43DRAFT_1137077 [Mycena crocata]|nr:hypothetical protein C8R43DRAFT_1137077 [Mycena crocata]
MIPQISSTQPLPGNPCRKRGSRPLRAGGAGHDGRLQAPPHNEFSLSPLQGASESKRGRLPGGMKPAVPRHLQSPLSTPSLIELFGFDEKQTYLCSNISIADLSFTAMARGTYPKARYYGGDAAGAVYVKSRRAKRTTRPSQNERLPRDISDLELKVGHAKNLPRRVQQYRKCESAAQEILWHGFFYAERRMHVERRIHLTLERHGAVRIRGECLGACCTTKHREYFNMRTIQTRAEFLRLCRGELRAAGEKDLKLHPMKDWYRISKSRIRKSRIQKSRT